MHKVFHINPGDRLNRYKTGFATIEIKTRFNLALKATSFKKAKSFMVDLVDMNFNLSALQSTAGVGFEVLANEILTFSLCDKEPCIDWRWLPPEHNVGMEILTENHVLWEFNANRINLYREGILYLPKRANHSVIDSWTKKGNVLFLFQITKQKTRRLGDKEIVFFNKIIWDEKKQQQRDIEIRFVYVVPTQIKKFDILNLKDFKLEVSIGVLTVDILKAKVDPIARDHIIEYLEMTIEITEESESTELFLNSDNTG